jgi:hypothetical protein
MTHPILKEPQTLVESIIQRYTTRATNEFDTARPTYRRSLGCNESANRLANLQIIAQRRIKVDLYLTPADIEVRFLRTVKSTSRDGLVLGTRIHRRRWLEELKKTLHDHALEKLDVTRLVVSKPCDLSARGVEEVLQMLLPAV